MKYIFLDFFGIYFILIAILAFYNAIFNLSPASVFWLSYFAFLFIGIGMILRKAYLIGSQLNIIFIPNIFWNIDFIYRIIKSESLLGLTDYFFKQGAPLISQIVTVQHLFIIPISIIAIYFIKLKRQDFWKLSIVQVFIIFILTRVFSDKELNINCVFTNCFSGTTNSLYPFQWFIIYILVIIISHCFLISFRSLRIKEPH
jgi:hypothetical protein